MIPREYIIVVITLTTLLIIGASTENSKTYDKSEWIPITEKYPPISENAKEHTRDKKATARVLNLTPDLTRYNSYFSDGQRKIFRRDNVQQFLEESPQRNSQQMYRPVSLNRGEFFNQQYYRQPQLISMPQLQFYGSNPNIFQQPNLLSQGITGPFNAPAIQEINQGLIGEYKQNQEGLSNDQNKDTVQLVYVPLETLNQRQVQNQGAFANFQPNQGKPTIEQNLSENEQLRLKNLQEQQLEKQQDNQRLHMSLEDQRMQSRREEEQFKALREQQRLKQVGKQQFPLPQYQLVTTISPNQHKQQQLQSIQNDFAQQALGAVKLQEQLLQGQDPLLPVPTQSNIKTNPTPNKRKAHQPPLAVYMAGSDEVSVTDVLNLLKTAKTISVQDTAGPEAPKVFVGPYNLNAPEGYVKFDLPYLNALDNNRIERKVEKLPFFVAPLSYNTPPGYSKIPLPAPHVGSVVVSHKEDVQESRPHYAIQNALPHNLDGKSPPPFRPNLVQSFKLEDALTQQPFNAPTTLRPNPLRQTINQYELEQINSHFVPTPQYGLQDEEDDDKRHALTSSNTPNLSKKRTRIPTQPNGNSEKHKYTVLEEFSLDPSRSTTTLRGTFDEVSKDATPLPVLSRYQQPPALGRKSLKQQIPSYYQLDSGEFTPVSIFGQENAENLGVSSINAPVLNGDVKTSHDKFTHPQEDTEFSSITTIEPVGRNSNENNFKVSNQLPPINPGLHSLINDLEDQSVRTLLVPASIAPTTEQSSYLIGTNNKREPSNRQRQNAQTRFTHKARGNNQKERHQTQLDGQSTQFNEPSKGYNDEYLQNYDQTGFIQNAKESEHPKQVQLEDQTNRYNVSPNSHNEEVLQNYEQKTKEVKRTQVRDQIDPYNQQPKDVSQVLEQKYDRTRLEQIKPPRTKENKLPQYQEPTIQYKEQPEVDQYKTNQYLEVPTRQAQTTYQTQLSEYQEKPEHYSTLPAVEDGIKEFLDKPNPESSYQNQPAINDVRTQQYHQEVQTRLQEQSNGHKDQPQQYHEQTKIYGESEVPPPIHDVQPVSYELSNTKEAHRLNPGDFNNLRESSIPDTTSTSQPTTTTSTEPTTTATRRFRGRTRSRTTTVTYSPSRRTRRTTVRPSTTLEYSTTTELPRSAANRLRSRTRQRPIVSDLTERSFSSTSTEQIQPQSYMQFEQPNVEELGTISKQDSKFNSPTEAIPSTTKQLPSLSVDVVINHPVTTFVDKEPEIITESKDNEPYVRFSANDITTKASIRIRPKQRVRPSSSTTTPKPVPEEQPQEEFYGFFRTPDFSRTHELNQTPLKPIFSTIAEPVTITTEKPRVRTRLRQSTTIDATTLSPRARQRGSSRFKVPDNAKSQSDDDGFQGENYPVSFLKGQTERPKFQITIDPANYGYDEDDQQPHSSINRPKIIRNDISIDRKMIESQEQVFTVKNATDSVKYAVPTFATGSDGDQNGDATTTTSKPQARRRGVWKLVKRPADTFDAAESQYVGNVAANSLTNEKSKDVKVIIFPVSDIATTEATTTTKEENFFDSIYEMFGISSDHLASAKKQNLKLEGKQLPGVETLKDSLALDVETAGVGTEQIVDIQSTLQGSEHPNETDTPKSSVPTAEPSNANTDDDVIEQGSIAGPEEISLPDYGPTSLMDEKEETSASINDEINNRGVTEMPHHGVTNLGGLSIDKASISNVEPTESKSEMQGYEQINLQDFENMNEEYKINETKANTPDPVEPTSAILENDFLNNHDSQIANFNPTGLYTSGSDLSSYGPLNQVELESDKATTNLPELRNQDDSTDLFVPTTKPADLTVNRVKGKASIEMWDLGKVITSTSTEVSHETEICYRGRCIKSPGIHNPSLP